MLNDGSVCIADREINDISEISQYCNGEDEYFFGRCDSSETIGDISCSIENNMFKISGLKHSGAVELNFTGLYVGYYTVDYTNSVPGHQDGYLMPGESIRVCFESARSVVEDEFMRLAFVPQYGAISVNDVWMPNPMTLANIHIYP